MTGDGGGGGGAMIQSVGTGFLTMTASQLVAINHGK